MKHKFILSKMKKSLPLMKDKELSNHIPETRWFTDHNVFLMLKHHDSLYIKPDKGLMGRNIIKISKAGDNHYLVHYKNRAKSCTDKQLIAEIRKKIKPGTKYIIQQGISLATYKGRPYDLRIVLQKPANTWKLTWMSAKIAPRKNSIVTNIAQGGENMRISKILKRMDQEIDRAAVENKLKTVSYKIAKKLGARFPVQILGLDIAIDTKGKVWFIEANTNPGFYGLRKVDPKLFNKYLQAKKQMERNNK